MHTILVIGGYGFFGGRICQALARNPTIRVLIGGRDLGSGRRLAQKLGLKEDQAVQIDANSPRLGDVLRQCQVRTVIHTAGPFQGQNYGVAQAAINSGCHYIDLADGRQFVSGISQLDAAAKLQGVTVVSGASSAPALSCAVVDRYLPAFEKLESICIGISSGARAPGLATVRGVFSYAGKPIRMLKGGSWVTAYGWRGLERHRFPSPVGQRWLGTIDVPDLEVLPQRYPTVGTVSFQAGFANDLGHLLIFCLAGLVKIRWIKSMTAFASPLNGFSRWIEPMISDKGGMFVTLHGISPDGRPHRVTWNLIVGHNHGPFVPCGASLVLATKLASGETLPIGAMPCLGLVTVAEYLSALSGLDLREVIE